MYRTNPRMTKILSSNPHIPTDSKYEPLRKNICPEVQTDSRPQITIGSKSKVSKVFRSLSPSETEYMRDNILIPANCQLKLTEKEQIRCRATSRKYRAISVEEKQQLKPLSPKALEKRKKNYQERVYEYWCPEQQEDQDGIFTFKKTEYGFDTKASLEASQSPRKTNPADSKMNNSRGYLANLYENGQNDCVTYAYWQNQGRNRYAQLGLSTKKELDKKVQSSKNIKIGGRKGIKKETSQNSIHTIGINSKPLIEKQTKDDNAPNKQLTTRTTQKIKDTIDSEVRKVQSRLVIGGKNGQENLNNLEDKDIRNNQGWNRQDYRSPETLERYKKLDQYKQGGYASYDFERNLGQLQERIRWKSNYKYNLFSVLDEQTNLKCKNGICSGNELVASEPQRERWT